MEVSKNKPGKNNKKSKKREKSFISRSKSILDLSFLTEPPPRFRRSRREKGRMATSSWSISPSEKEVKPIRTTRWMRSRSMDSSSYSYNEEGPEFDDRSETVSSEGSWEDDSQSSQFQSSISAGSDAVFKEETDRDATLTPNFSERKHGLKHLSRSTPTMSPSGSPQHSDSEGPSHVSRRTKKFLRRFHTVPPSERVINYYACAIVSDILLQGTLYITDNYFAFYSNIFGYVNRTLIPIAEVTRIQKEKTAKFIPNAVGLQTADGKTFVFSSLISRDATYKFMIHMWRKSRKLTDSDIESTIPVMSEVACIDDSASNSGDSIADDVDFADVENFDQLASQNATAWSKSSPMIVATAFPTQTSVTYSDNTSSNTTPETCISSTSFNDFRNSVDALRTSPSEEDALFERKSNISQRMCQTDMNSGNSRNGRILWTVHTKVVKTVVSIGVAPFRAVREGLQEITFQPKKSFLLLASSSLVFFLLASAAFMIYRVESLNDQLNSSSFQYGDLYEEVLQMQQKLHAATAKEIEKTLNLQIRQLVTVKQSLEALIFLLNTDHSSPAPHIQEAGY